MSCWSIVTLARGDEAFPELFLFHPVGGSALGYQPLVDALESRCAVHAFHMTRTSGTCPDAGMLIQAYAARVQEQSSGDVVLGGWSLGGLIALEVAACLRLDGTPAAFVTAVDTPPPGRRICCGGDVDLSREFAHDVGQMLDRQIATRAAEAGGSVHAALAAIASAVPELSYDDVCRRWEIFRWLSYAVDALPPRRYGEDVLLVSAVDDEKASREWEAAVDGRLTRETVGGDHYRIVERPTVERVAAAMDRAIGAAESITR